MQTLYECTVLLEEHDRTIERFLAIDLRTEVDGAESLEDLFEYLGDPEDSEN